MQLHLWFRNFPDSKGIKTEEAGEYGLDSWFRNFPDSKGIKTELLSIHPHGLSDVAASVGNVIMGISMSYMHGKESKTEVYDIMSLIS